MVGITFRKRIVNNVYLEVFTTYEEYLKTNEVKVSLESLITYSIYKYCTNPFVAVQFIYVDKGPEIKKTAVTLSDMNLKFMDVNAVPWPVDLCIYPVIMCDDFIVTGLSAVVRHICKHKNGPNTIEEHEDGLLGFRQSCLQAPNEVSIWTKFCEVDIINTVKEILTAVDLQVVPKHLVRFEDHLKKPVRIHNVYKVARGMKKDNLNVEQATSKTERSKQSSAEDSKQSNAIDSEQSGTVGLKQKDSEDLKQSSTENSRHSGKENSKQIDTENSKQSGTEDSRQSSTEDSRQSGTEDSRQSDTEDLKESGKVRKEPKARKWKSNKNKENQIDCSTRVEDLLVAHQYAEGPFLTLADLVLLPSYHIIIQSFGEPKFESLLPFTYKWYKNLLSLPQIETYISYMSKMNLKLLSSDTVILPITDDVSLYKCDPKRHNPKKRLFTKEDDIEKALSSIKEDMELTMSNNELDNFIDWDKIPEEANPNGGHLPDVRVGRKSQQLENIAFAVSTIVKEGDLIVDFCCGSGHLGILLAYLLPRCTVILLENRVESLMRARERVQKMCLENVFFYQCNVDFFIGKFDIGIGLHACGIASDLILDKCLKVKAKFVLTPCCYGSIHATDRFVYPRSTKFSSVPIDQYLCIAHAADQTHVEHPLAIRGARCMAVIDSDRGCLAEESGYKVTLSRLKPLTCTLKNNLLIGVPIK